MSDTKSDDNNAIVIAIALFALVFLGIPAFYAAKAPLLNGIALKLTEMQLRPFALFSPEAQKALTFVSGLDPAAVQWEQLVRIFSYTGKWLCWPMFLILGCLVGVSCLLSRAESLTRRFDMKSLVRNNAEVFPCLYPVAGRGDKLLSLDSFDTGLWKIARNPIQFALENELLTDDEGTVPIPDQVLKKGLARPDCRLFGHSHFDRKKAVQLMERQLGERQEQGLDQLAPVRKVLAIALMAYAGGDKETCLRILNTVALSYEEKEDQAVVDILAPKSKKRKEFNEFKNLLKHTRKKHKDVLQDPLLCRHNAFVLPWFMGLLTCARRKGVLATSQFLWLRPLDRPLWYALNQCGGRVAWPEALAAWAHFTSEEQAGRALTTPESISAAFSLEKELFVQGWLPEFGKDIQKDTPAGPQEPEHRAESEELPQHFGGEDSICWAEKDQDTAIYDAEEDPELKNQLV